MEDGKRLYTQDNENYEEIMCSTLSFRDQRALIFQLLYAVDRFDYNTSLDSIIDSFYRGYNIVISQEGDTFKETQSIIDDRDNIDSKIQPLITNWRFDRLGLITRLILRMGAWDLLHLQKDSNIIINEAVEIAKCFAEKDAHKFINGVLDEFVKKYKQESNNNEN